MLDDEMGRAPGVEPVARGKRFRRYRDLDHGIATCPWLLDRARRTLLALMGYVDAEGICWPSVARLARETGQHVRTVKRALADLRGAGIVVRVRPGVLGVNLDMVASLAGDSRVPWGDTAVPRGVTPASPGRGHGCHTELCLQEQETNQHTQPSPPAPSPAPAPDVCAVEGDEAREHRVRWVAEAFPLARDREGQLVIPRALHGAIAGACESWPAPIVRRAVELVGAQPWRSADLGAWVFTSSSWGACVQHAQTEARRRVARPKVVAPVVVVAQEERPSAEDLASWRRAVG